MRAPRSVKQALNTNQGCAHSMKKLALIVRSMCGQVEQREAQARREREKKARALAEEALKALRVGQFRNAVVTAG